MTHKTPWQRVFKTIKYYATTLDTVTRHTSSSWHLPLRVEYDRSVCFRTYLYHSFYPDNSYFEYGSQ